MLGWVLGWIITIWLINLFCKIFLGVSPIKAIKGIFLSQKSLSSSEKQRLLELEEKELNRQLKKYEHKEMREFDKKLKIKFK